MYITIFALYRLYDMKILIPQDSSDITLKQYMSYVNLLKDNPENIDRKKIEIFCGIPTNSDIKQKDYKEILDQIDIALDTNSEFQDRFKMDGIEFGFIPNLDNIIFSEFVDIKKYEPKIEDEQIDNIEDLNKLIAILFRPITDTKYDTYQIETYNGTGKYANKMLDTPMNIVNGALFFFSSLAKELQETIQRYTQEVQATDRKQQTTLVSGDGTLH